MAIEDELVPLEDILKRASVEPAHRPEFYQVLMQSNVCIIGHSDNGASGETLLKEGSDVHIQNWEKNDGTPIIPFFTSIEELQKSITEDVSYLELPASSLFEITQGAWLVLNPYSDYSKEFTPEEISQLLGGRIPGDTGEEQIVEVDTSVLVGQPSEYPSRLVDSLTTLFSKSDVIEAAYLAYVYNPSEKGKPHIMIGLVTDEEHFRQISPQAGAVASSVIETGEHVDFLFIDRGRKAESEGITGYMLQQTDPFYRSEWRHRITPGTGNA